MYVCMPACVYVSAVPEPEGIKSLGTRVTGSCELTKMGAGN